jgi:hypothetical protein
MKDIKNELFGSPEQAEERRNELKKEIKDELAGTPEEIEERRQLLMKDIKNELFGSPEQAEERRNALKKEIKDEMQETPEETEAKRSALKQELKDELKEEMKAQPEEKPAQEETTAKESDKGNGADVNVVPIVFAASQAANEPVAKPAPETPAPEEEETDDEMEEFVKKPWKVICPNCFKQLKTGVGSKHQCCPTCNKVFEIQKAVRLKEGDPENNEQPNETKENEAKD